MFLSKGYKGFYYLYFKDETTGKRNKVSTRTKQKSEANKFLKDFNVIQSQDQPNQTLEISLIELQEEIKKYVKNHFTFKTYQIYEGVLRNLIKIIGNKALRLINIQDIEQYKAQRLESVCKTSVNIEIRTLKAIFNTAFKWNFIKLNPAKEVKQMIVNQKERLAFKEEEIFILLNSITDSKFKNLILLTLYTGMRLDEVLNIQYKDIDINERTIIVRNKSNFKTKTGKIREIPISDFLFTIVQEIREVEANSNILKLYCPEDYLFKNPIGKRYEKNYISKKFKKCLRKAELDEKYHFHCLRHTFLTQLAKKGVSIYLLKEIAGHSSIKTTELYLHTVTDDLREAVNKISINQ